MNNVKRNENGKIDLYLCNDMGSHMRLMGEYDNLKDLREEGKRLLLAQEECADGFYAREFCYPVKQSGGDTGLHFEWIK